MSRNLFIAALMFLLVAGRSHALPDDRRQPITLKAAKVEINHKRGVSTYEGGVELQQGSLHISATRIIIRSKNNEVVRIEAEGTPVKIHQRPAPNKEETRAEARRIEYDPKLGTVLLTGKAHIWQDGNEFSGETITYDSHKDIVRADGGKQNNGRVEVIIQPSKEKTP